jgi:hypothetical protein
MESTLRNDKNLHKTNWIRSVLAKGVKPDIIVLDTLPDRTEEYSKNEIMLWLNESETRFIKKYRLEGHPLTNLTDGGSGPVGFKMPEDAKRRISKTLKGRVFSDSHKELISIRKSGVPQSDEHKLALSKVREGRIISESTKAKISASHKGKVLPEETKRRISIAKKGIPKTEDQMKKMWDTRRAKYGPLGRSIK